jgi:hypothetical protein
MPTENIGSKNSHNHFHKYSQSFEKKLQKSIKYK